MKTLFIVLSLICLCLAATDRDLFLKFMVNKELKKINSISSLLNFFFILIPPSFYSLRRKTIKETINPNLNKKEDTEFSLKMSI